MNCPDCVGFFHGHYLKLTDNFTENEMFIATPPSIVISEFFAQKQEKIWNDSEVEQLAINVLLPPREVNICFGSI